MRAGRRQWLCEEIAGFPAFFILVIIAAGRINVSDIYLAFSGNYHMFLKIWSVGRVVKKKGIIFENVILKL